MENIGLSQTYICIGGYVVNNGLHENCLVFKEHKAEKDDQGDFIIIQLQVKFTVSFHSSSSKNGCIAADIH